MTDLGREVKLIAGKATYRLYAGNKALRLIERETGKPLLESLVSLSDEASVDVNVLTTIVWALLQRNHPDLSIDDVDDIIDDAGGWMELIDPLGDAINRAFPNATDEASSSGKARRGTGTRSSPAHSPPV